MYGQPQPVYQQPPMVPQPGYGQPQPYAQPVAVVQQPVMVQQPVLVQQPPPQPQQPQIVVIQQQVQAKKKVAEEFDGLCNCFSDLGTCCMAMFCPCCLFGSNNSKVGVGDNLFCTAAYLVGMFFDVYWFCGCYQRGKMREVMGLPDEGSIVPCCMHAFCPVCALAQEARAVAKWVRQ